MAKGDPQTYDTSKGFGNPEQWRKAFKARMTDIEVERALNGRSAYEVLGISNTSSAEQIKSAFRRKALLYHPDKNAESASEFMAIQAAYQKLSV